VWTVGLLELIIKIKTVLGITRAAQIIIIAITATDILISVNVCLRLLRRPLSGF
jgi:hypothetical protein